MTELDLDDIMTSIQIGEYQEIVEQVRAATDPELKKKLKTSLPAFTGSGTFSKRLNESLIKHSGRIIIDLDHLEDVNEAKSQLGADEFVEYAFTSVGGQGLAVVFKIDGSTHGQSFQQIKQYIETKYGYQVDKGVKEVARLSSSRLTLISCTTPTRSWEPQHSGGEYTTRRISNNRTLTRRSRASVIFSE